MRTRIKRLSLTDVGPWLISLSIILLCLLLAPASILASFEPDDANIPLGNRTPLILIHGWCGNQQDTWGTFRTRFKQDVTLTEKFKLYLFYFDTGGNWAPFTCPDVNTNHTVARARTLAQELKSHIDNILPNTNRQVAILAHSFGGLIGRSYLQEFETSRSPLVLISLATPHHGTLIANDFDIGNERTALYWDRYDNAFEPQNDWLRCLNGLPENSSTQTACTSFTATEQRRLAVFPKIVALGVVRPNSLNDVYPDDVLVPIQSALLDDSTPWIRSRYRGTGGQDDGSNCQGSFIAHQAIHEDNCLVEEEPSWGHGLRDVFTIIRGELLAAVSAPESPLTLSITATPDPVKPGEQIIYSFTVANHGTSDSNLVGLSTHVPFHTTTWTSQMIPAGNCGFSFCNTGARVTWTLGTILAGQSRTVQMAADVDAGGSTPADGTI